MAARNWTKNLVKIICAMSFVAAIVKSILTLFSLETNLSSEIVANYVPLPALTMCPVLAKPQYASPIKFGQNSTLTEVMEQDLPLSDGHILECSWTMMDSLRSLDTR